MDDILELFADFERKTIWLLRDLTVRPSLVLKSVHDKSKTYTSPFRFYWLSTSITIILLIVFNAFDHTNLWDVEEEMLMPPFWSSYLISFREFTLAVVPFYLFVVSIPTFTIISMVVFGISKKSFLSIIKYFSYLIGWCLLYFSLIQIITLPFTFFDWNGSDEIAFLFLFLIILIPVLFLIRGCLVLSKKLIKGVFQSVFVLGTTLSLGYILWLPNDIEFLHDKIMYFNYDSKEPIRQQADEKRTQFRESISLSAAPVISSNNMVVFSDDWDLAGGLVDSARQWVVLNKNGQVVQKKNLPMYVGMYSGYIADDNTVLAYQSSYTPDKTYVQLSSPKDSFVDSSSIFIKNHSIIKRVKNNIWMSGQDENGPALRIYQDDFTRKEVQIPLENSEIDDFIVSENKSTVFLLTSGSQGRNLGGLHLQKIRVNEDGIKILASHTLANLPASQMPSFVQFDLYTHNTAQAKIKFLQDSSRILVGYQLMHEKSYTQYLQVVDTTNLTPVWSESYTFDADLSIFDNWQVRGETIFLQGRAFTIIREGFDVSKYYNVFIQKIDLQDGELVASRIYDPTININFFNSVIYFDHPFFSVTDSLYVGFPDGDHAHHLMMEKF